MSKPEFVYVSYIRTTPELLYRALTERAFMERYWGLVLDSDWEVGSAITWERNGSRHSDPRQVVLEADPSPPAVLHLARDNAGVEPLAQRGAPPPRRGRTALAGHLRARTARRARQADGAPRPVRAGQHRCADGHQGLAHRDLEPEDVARDRRNPAGRRLSFRGSLDMQPVGCVSSPRYAVFWLHMAWAMPLAA